MLLCQKLNVIRIILLLQEHKEGIKARKTSFQTHLNIILCCCFVQSKCSGTILVVRSLRLAFVCCRSFLKLCFI